MRSLHLLLGILSLLVLPLSSYASLVVMPQNFYTVTLPYDNAVNSADVTQANTPQNLPLLTQKTRQGMRILLLRLTGQTRLVDSKVGQNYIEQAQDWLATYNIKARQEDGVTVGQNIEMTFDEARLKSSFAQHHIKLWAHSQRPKTLVMGSFVQQGRLVKLNTEILDYRVDVDFRTYLAMIGLPVLIPDDRDSWVYPVEPERLYTQIQEVLLSHNQQNLLSFKLLAKGQGEYELAWYLFSTSGRTLAKQVLTGADRQVLMTQMFETVMQQYVKLAAVKNIRKNHILIHVDQITFGDQVNQLEQELQAQQPMIRKANLVSLSAGTAQFDIEYQGELQSVLNWFNSWNKLQFVNLSADKQELKASAVYSNFKPQYKIKDDSDEGQMTR
ncbi:MAG: DUF2066 domain-containing protein [Thiomicrorhabdus sp.]|nr:DUF2066 domain-containing protein [Thiomicrorhabdus sp.]